MNLKITYHSAAEAEEAFYTAFQNLDLVQMRQVWANSASAYCIHPSGQLFQGYDAILTSWNKIFQGAEKPRVHYSLIGQNNQENLAVHLVVERISSSSEAAETGAVVFATNVYLLTETGWHMLSHHAAQARFEPGSPKTQKKLH